MHADKGLSAAYKRLLDAAKTDPGSVQSIAAELLPTAREEIVGMACFDIDNALRKGRDTEAFKLVKGILHEMRETHG